MSKWHSFLEYIQFPIKVLFFAMVLLGMGSIMLNSNVGLLEIFDLEILHTIAIAFQYIGGFLFKLFPLLVFLKVLTRKYEDSAPVFIGFFSLIVILVIVMLLSKNEYPSYFYTSLLGIHANIITYGNKVSSLYTPYNMGIIPLLLAYYITSIAYRRSRHHIRHGAFYFIDHDTWAIIIAFVMSVVTGIALSFIWPWIITGMQLLFTYIAEDIYDVGRMFLYGIFERISAVLNMDEICKNVFWLSEAGGSTVSSTGSVYLGDSGLWDAFINGNTQVLKTGQFMGAYYIINIGIIPGFILAYHRLMDTKENRRKYIVFILFAMLASIICGNPLPFEMLMMILSPLLFVFYLLMVGLAFVVVSVIGSLPGYSVTGEIFTAMPGSIIDLLCNMKHSVLFSGCIILLVSCVVFFIIFYLATIFYFKKAAIGFLSMHDSKQIALQTVEAMGGLDNIVSLEATPDKMNVAFVSREEVDMKKLHEAGAYLVLESKEGYTIRLGNMSIMIKNEIQKLLNEK